MSSGRGSRDMRGHFYIIAAGIWLALTSRRWRRRWRAHGRVRDVMWQPDQEQP